MPSPALLLAAAAVVGAQQIDFAQPEEHPKFSWKRCASAGNCESVQAEIVLDAEWRWIHNLGGYDNCHWDNQWEASLCPDDDTCTENCAIDGATYEYTYGIVTKGDRLTQPYITHADFSSSRASRVYLMENEDTYQTFTLMDNEIAFDVDVSTVVCGLNSALRFLEMDADGGLARYPETNKGGAKYGVGHCDSDCTQRNRYVGGKANVEGWTPHEDPRFGGSGARGACCAEFDVWNSNSHSYSMASKPCNIVEYDTCIYEDCEPGREAFIWCEAQGCSYNPYQLGATDFYGPGKVLDSTKNFTVVTRFEEAAVTQFFIQDGKKIEPPRSTYPEVPDVSGLNEEFCDVLPDLFVMRDIFESIGGYPNHNEMLRRPMVLSLSISADYGYHNLWLDSLFPPENEGYPGVARGDCIPEDNDPAVVEELGGRSKAVWSNIRFGPIGSTVDI